MLRIPLPTLPAVNETLLNLPSLASIPSVSTQSITPRTTMTVCTHLLLPGSILS